MGRKIIHIDMDCFYAAIEMRDHPEWRGKPLAVGGQPGQRGVVATSNYIARKFGVRSAMSSALALKKCPQLLLVPPRFEVYRNESRKIREVFKRYTSIIEPLSLDEAFLDVSDCELYDGSATKIAWHIRKEIFETTGLTASAGIAPNKFLAKVASDWEKPNGQTTVSPKDVDDFVFSLPVEKIFGVGKVMAQKLYQRGYKTCGDLRQVERLQLMREFGNMGAYLFDLSRGIDNREVKAQRQRKSISVERTFNSDVNTLEELLQKIDKIHQELIQRCQKNEISETIVTTMILKIKFFDFKQVTYETKVSHLSSCEEFKELLANYFEDKEYVPVRLLGLGFKIDKDSRVDQLSLDGVF